MPNCFPVNSEVTTDALFGGQLVIRQPKAGYRFSIDAILLAGLVTPRPRDRVVDIGTGCGVVSLILAFRFPEIQIRGVEIQPSLADLARENVRRNGFEDRIEVVTADLCRTAPRQPGGPFDLAVCNPPYRRARSGRINPHPQKALARHELCTCLADVTAASFRLLKKGGRAALIYPAERIADLIAEMRTAGVEPKRLRLLHSRSDAGAKLVFAEGTAGGRPGAAVAPPLAIYEPGGGYSPEVKQMLEGRAKRTGQRA